MTEAASVFPDLHVLDLSSRLSGAFCARLLGDFGADVVMAEPPGGHPLRQEEPLLPDAPTAERSILHQYVNANKRSLVLETQDTQTLEALVRWADIVVTNDEAVDFDRFEQLKPGIVVASITAYGLTGPLAGAPGDDLTANALSSWAAAQGEPDRPPLTSAQNQVGYLAGINAAVAAVAAIFDRDRTGLGQLIDASELEPLTLIAGPQMLVAEYAGAVNPRHRADMVRGPIASADGYISLTLSRAHFWRDAMNVLGLRDLAEDERYGNGPFRQQHRDEYSGRVEAAVQQWDRWALFHTLAELRCVVGVVQDMADLAKNEHLESRGFLLDIPLPGGRTARFPGAPLKMSLTPWALRRPAPRLGEHSDEVLSTLGLAAGVEAKS